MAPPPTSSAPGGRSLLEVALHWGGATVAARSLAEGTLSVGEGPGCDLFLSHPAFGARHALALVRGPAVQLRLPEGVPVRLVSEGRLSERPALAASGRLGAGRLDLGPTEALELALGPVLLRVRRVPAPTVVRREPLEDQDFAFATLMAAALLVFVALGVAAAITPPPEWEGTSATPSRYVKLVVPPLPPQDLSRRTPLDAARPRERQERREERPQDRPRARGAASSSPKSEADRQKVTHLLAGLLGAGPGGGDLGVGLSPQVDAALGGLRTAGGAGDLRGMGGLGARGGASGGGGLGLGLGGSAGVGGPAPGTVQLGDGPAREPVRVIPGRTTVVGGLEREVIARVIERHQAEIKFCFETELQRRPDLAGKVAVAWTIDAAGAVAEASVSESTMGSPEVERCILDRVRRWRFPQPRGGGVVEVSFPWIFKAAGDVPPGGAP